MRRIALTQGKYALVDDDDYHRVAHVRWFAHRNGRTWYALRHAPGNHARMLWMHREILGVSAGVEVDHVNGNGLDNRRKNLRPATRQQQNANSRGRQGRRAPYKGVYYDARQGERPWLARIRVNKRVRHIGYYRTARGAHQAYCRAARHYFGEFARNT